MVAVRKMKAGTPKADLQQTKENIRNKQSCSMRYRNDKKISVKQAPWEEKCTNRTASE